MNIGKQSTTPFIIVAALLLTLAACNSKRESHTPAPVAAQPTPDPFTGAWKYNNTIWSEYELSLEENGRFTFCNTTCLGQNFSRGQWTVADGILQLTSDDAFKEKKEVSVRKNTRPVKIKLKNGEYQPIDFTEMPELSMPGPNDTSLVYFNKVSFQLKGDTLYSTGKNKLLEAAKFCKII